MVFHADSDALAQEIDLDDRPASVGRVDKGFHLRRGLDEVLIGLLLVFQAAHEPAARAGDLRRIQAEVLRLGHFDGNRLEIIEEFLAAEGPAAYAESADHLGLVAHADLPQLNARAEDGGQILDQLAEIDASVRREEKQKLAAVKGAFRRDKLHFQPVRGDLLLADLKGLLFLFLVLCVRALVLLRRYAQHPAQRQHQLTRLDRVVAGSADAEFVSARRVDDDVRTGLQRQSGRVKIIGFCVIAEADVHHGNGGRLRRLGGRFLLCRRGGFRGLLCIRRRLLRCGFRFCGGGLLLQNGIGGLFLHGSLQSAAEPAAR